MDRDLADCLQSRDYTGSIEAVLVSHACATGITPQTRTGMGFEENNDPFPRPEGGGTVPGACFGNPEVHRGYGIRKK